MARPPPRKAIPAASPRITRPRRTPVAAACSAVLLAAVTAAGSARAQPPEDSLACADWRGELEQIEGVVEIQRSESDNWIRVLDHAVVCFGDSVRAQPYGRAVFRTRDQSLIRINELTTLTLPPPPDGLGTLIELIRGVIHVISRDPRSLRFTTPYANAGLEGTEFDIRVAESARTTEVAVLEGEVVVTTPMGRIGVPTGFVASAREGQAPESRAILEPIELMRWGSYFPEILDVELPAPDREPVLSESNDAAFFAARAAARLRRGNLETAELDIASSLRLAPDNATALALQAILALGRNDSAAALENARAAAATTPASAPAFIALSYTLQAAGELDAALASIDAALSVEPNNAIARARRAEIQLGRSQWDESRDSAVRAIALRPSFGYGHTVLGFVELSAGNVTAAIAAFERAASLDRGAPLPHLGLGLARIQRGDFVLGRQQLEIAVALDPANALTRSYMAKTYDAENRTKLPATQLALARRFDPNDPTPWLYDSLLKLNGNRPVEALQDLLAAIERNDNRALFRSRLAMDADLATRSAGTGRVLRELGFEQLALVRGWAATAVNPTDYAAHRLLFDAYSATPRHEISRASALYTSQLLQPANLTPVQARLGETSPLLVTRAAPSEVAFTELTPLVTANGLRVQASTVVGANDTFGEDVALAGLRDRVSYSFGQFHYSTDGFRENSDFDQTIRNGLVQFNVDERTSLLAELRSSEIERGDISRYFDPTRYLADFRTEESADTLRVGGRRRIGASDTLLVSLSKQESAAAFSSGGFGAIVDSDGYSADVQDIHENTRWNLRTGLWLGERDVIQTTSIGTVPLGTDTSRSEQRSAYAYADVFVARSLTLTVGASADSVTEPLVDRHQVSPKLGVTWMATDKITIRGASFETLLGSFSTSKNNPQPRLEPVQVAGFNQFPLGANADLSTANGFAVDAEISASVFAGIELLSRSVDTTFTEPAPPGLQIPPSVYPAEYWEDGAAAYLYWTPRQDVSFGARYEADRLEIDGTTGFGLAHSRTKRMPLEAHYFRPNGLTAGLRASWFDQRGEFFPPGSDIAAPGRDRFWILDASLGFRLPNRRGVLSLNIDNLLDTEFQFQDVDPENPSIAPERMAYFRFTLSFE